MERLSKDLPLTRAMAGHVIEKELNVKSRHAIWQEHLYELAGFKELLGAATTDRLKMKDNTVMPEELVAIAVVRIGIKNRDAYPALDRLSVRCTAVGDGKVEITGGSEGGVVQVDFTLDFPQERLMFDWNGGDFRIADDGTEAGARQIASALKFLIDYIGNGKLQVFDAQTGLLLGRKDAYLPVNIMPHRAAEYFNEEIEKCEAEAERRALRAQEPGSGA